MELVKQNAEIFVPDGMEVDKAIARTTHICISAHQDDIEIMAFHGALQCFGVSDKWFMGVVVTDGAGSPRDDIYANYTDADMQSIRKLEQKKAAFVGEYSAQALLMYSSKEVKDAVNKDVVADLKNLLMQAKPEVVYTHNPADKHDTHVSVMLRVIKAIRDMPKADRPKAVYGCEVWRGLDWMIDDDKVVLDVSAHENIGAAILAVFDSQICGGKRYDLATAGRRKANATYHASHGTDVSTALNFAIDLTPLIVDDTKDPEEYIKSYIDRFTSEILSRVNQFK